MIVVSDSSPLITLAKIDCLHLLPGLYVSVTIPAEVHQEVVVAGAGLPGSSQVSRAEWLEVRRLADPTALDAARTKWGLGPGELAAILLSRELHADLTLIDDFDARRLARASGLRLRGSVGVLETAFRRGLLTDLREAYARLLQQRAYIDRKILEASLRSLNLPPL